MRKVKRKNIISRRNILICVSVFMLVMLVLAIYRMSGTFSYKADPIPQASPVVESEEAAALREKYSLVNVKYIRSISFKEKLRIEGTLKNSLETVSVNGDKAGIVYNRLNWNYEVPLNLRTKTNIVISVMNDSGKPNEVNFEVTRYLLGDSNNDGLVDSKDLNNYISNRGYTKEKNENVDFNEDNVIDYKDLSILMTNWTN